MSKKTTEESAKSREDEHSPQNGASTSSSSMKGIVSDKISDEGEEDGERTKDKPKKTPKPSTTRSTRPLDGDYDSLPVKLALPPQLRKQLTDEHYTIHQSKELVPLPRTPCVHDILQNWVSETTTSDSPETMAVIDMIQLLFQDELGNHLLYRLERYQYAEFVSRNPNVSVDKVYGAEHLLRLFVILPWFLSHAPLEETRIHTVKTVVTNLLEYMRLNMSTFFAQEYEPATPAALQDAGYS